VGAKSLALVVVLTALTCAAPAAAVPPKPPAKLPATSWILVDPASGDVLAARDPKVPLPVASATKLMTYFVASRKLRPKREVVVAPYDAIPSESLAGLEEGDTMTARDLFYGLIVPSGNDAANTLALAASGSVPDFVARMNAAAGELKLSETEYLDPIGLDSGNVSSARDLVDLTVELRKDPLFREITDTPRITLRSGAEPIMVENRNTLVLEEPFVDGVKTGTTIEAGFVLVGSGSRRGVELVSAVLGSPDAGARDAATLALLDYGFSLYEKRTLVAAGERVGSALLADGGGRLALESAEEVTAVARKDQKVEIDVVEAAPVTGPLTRGAPVTTAKVRLGQRQIAEIEVLAAQAVEAPANGDGSDGSLPGWAWLVFGAAGVVAIVLGSMALAKSRAA
jgi:D-alanyl-D-alanine carboxypeptidase (penicillin-binding protein 5/6)